jgi:hypothetical protein
VAKSYLINSLRFNRIQENVDWNSDPWRNRSATRIRKW